jgi:gamma-glutamylcyclotransferase (GGCT)/AIG2-like uncharacterized protein YtfP
MPLLFVYGSLMRGEPNAARMAGASLQERAWTAAAYTLVDLGAWPALVEGGSDSVAGEIYSVSAAERDALDDFEEHPRLYVRAPVLLADGRTIDAYLLPRARVQTRGGVRIPSGDWKKRGRAG